MNSHPIQPFGIGLRGPVEIVNRGLSGPDRSKSAHATAIYGAVLTLSTLQPATLLNRRATTLAMTPKPGAPEIGWDVAVERYNATDCTYWITVRNLTNSDVTFEGRFAVLS